MRKFLIPKGYTLVELLVVMGVVAAVGTVIASILFVSIRGVKKSDTLETIRQNGDAALSQIVKNIRYAKSLDTPASCVPTTTTSSITITSQIDDAQTVLSCASSTLSSNSASLLDTNAVTTSTCSFTCTQANVNDPPIITIEFTLMNKTPSNFIESSGTTSFQNSVTLRNYVAK